MNSDTRLKVATALMNAASRITRGPGKMITRMLERRPLIAAGLDNMRVALPGRTTQTFGDIAPSMQQMALSGFNKKMPLTAQTRNRMAQYLRSAKPKYEMFSGAPEFYPDSQFREMPLPSGGRLPIKFDGYAMGMAQHPQFTSQFHAPGGAPGMKFTARSTGAANKGMWNGVQAPINIPSQPEWEAIRAKNPLKFR